MRFFYLVALGTMVAGYQVDAQQAWTGVIPALRVACLSGTSTSGQNDDIGGKLMTALKAGKAKKMGFPFFTQATKTTSGGAEVLNWEVCGAVDGTFAPTGQLTVRDLSPTPGALLFCASGDDQLAQKCADKLTAFVSQGDASQTPTIAVLPILSPQYTSASEIQTNAPKWIQDQPINLEADVPVGSDGETIDVALAGKDTTLRPLFVKGVNSYLATPDRMPKSVANAGVLAFVPVSAEKKAALDAAIKGTSK
jgi:hypothetical protein